MLFLLVDGNHLSRVEAHTSSASGVMFIFHTSLWCQLSVGRRITLRRWTTQFLCHFGPRVGPWTNSCQMLVDSKGHFNSWRCIKFNSIRSSSLLPTNIPTPSAFTAAQCPKDYCYVGKIWKRSQHLLLWGKLGAVESFRITLSLWRKGISLNWQNWEPLWK